MTLGTFLLAIAFGCLLAVPVMAFVFLLAWCANRWLP
ncbi:MAG: hypothetical protein K0R61_5 [Microvirga sp.]|jgi:hypothetical protein|nr:hypothetical protein [Microvirga sp.]MDF2969555.1 hypothetical protein [Microvirga sp.]